MEIKKVGVVGCGLMGAGLWKCIPSIFSGRLVATAISVTDKQEVLVPRMAC